MNVKRLVHILVMCLVVSFSLNAQSTSTDWGWDWKDTAKVAARNMPQQNEFLNNQYPYPAKPRSQWELGIGLGPAFILADVAPNVGLGGNVTFRKALSHVFSLRPGYTGILASGNARPSIGARGYKNQSHMLGVDLIASLNSISHYRGNPKTDLYVLAGYNFIGTQVTYKETAGGSSLYRPGDPALPFSNDALVGTIGDSWALLHGANLGFGAAFKINRKVNFGLEQKFTFIARGGYFYLDGYRAGGGRNDYYSLTTARLNINLGNTAKRVEPLWWLNPNNYVYNELNSPRHMKMPPIVLPDADGDGVTDQFDLEPNTPKGCPVDTHGVSRDTDGDGVPDCRDKELLTPQSCFPVNSDGVGTCPEPACCKELRDKLANMGPVQSNACTIGSLPSIQFKGNAKLSKEAQATLAGVASKINANPACNVKVIGYGASGKAAQQLSWERVNAVIKYLTEKQGIAESRLVFTYGQDGDVNTVDLQGTTETGSGNVPAPHPYIKKK